MKKQKIKYEESTLNFRVSNELKSTILRRAQEMNITSSKYLRAVLEEAHSATPHKFEEKQLTKIFLSIDFLKLMVWIYNKRESSKLVESKEELIGYTRTLKRLDGHLPDEIVTEFDKVLTNIISIKKDRTYGVEHFDFPDSYDVNLRFDFKKVEQHLLGMSSDD